VEKLNKTTNNIGIGGFWAWNVQMAGTWRRWTLHFVATSNTPLRHTRCVMPELEQRLRREITATSLTHLSRVNIAGWAFASSHNNAGLSARCEVRRLVLLQIEFFPVNMSAYTAYRLHSTVNVSPSRGYSWFRSALFWNCTHSMVVIPYRRILDLLTFGVGTDRLSRDVCKELLLYAASYHRRAQRKNSGLINECRHTAVAVFCEISKKILT